MTGKVTTQPKIAFSKSRVTENYRMSMEKGMTYPRTEAFLHLLLMESA